jgi:hypothetical protein
MEAQLHSKFTPRLNRDIREHFGSAQHWRFKEFPSTDTPESPPLPLLTLRLSRVTYGSVTLWLDVLGLDNDTLLPILAAALEVYAPNAMNSMPGYSVPMRVSVSPVPAAVATTAAPLPATVSPAPETKGSAAREAAQRIMTIARDSVLLIPVALALTVAYIAFSAFSEQLKDGRQEHRALLQSSLDFAKIVTEHNAAMARVIQQSAADVTKSLTELQQLQLDELKARQAQKIAPPSPVRPEPRRHCLLSLWCD